MLEKFTFNNGEVTYKEDMFPYVVDFVIRAFPSVDITIHYANTVRTTKSYEIAIDAVSHSYTCVKYLTVEAEGSVIYVSPTLAKATAGNITAESIVMHNGVISIENAADTLVKRGMEWRQVLIAAANILQRARVYYDDCHELCYLPTDCLPTIDLEPTHYYEVYVEGLYRGRPTRVGISADDFLYICAGNEKLENEIADLIKEE